MLPKNQIFHFDTFRDARGSLCVCESNMDFQIRRVFWINNVPKGERRGKHASVHGNEIIVLTAGSCKIDLHDGVLQHTFLLTNPMSALLIPKMTWRILYAFSSDCILTVLADCPYDPSDMITDFDTFIDVANYSRTSCI